MNTILWLASWYPSKIAPFDGDFIQRHAKALALIQPVHVVHVVKDARGVVSRGLLIEEAQNGYLKETIVYYKPFRTGWSPADQLISLVTYYRVYRNYLKNHLKKNGNPALVHLHVVMRAGLMAVWLKKKFSIPYLVTEHWTGYNRLAEVNYYHKNFFFRYITKKVLKHASLLLPVSKDLGDTISQNIQHIQYSVVHNVADTSVFRYNNHQAPVFRFVHVSSMNYQKNIPGILHCIKKLWLLSHNWELVMIGPAEEDIQNYSYQLGLHQKLRWVGELPYEEVANHMRQASACVLFSRYENLPCVLIEAACCGLPVIAPRMGGIPEIVQHYNGVLTEPGNEDEMVQAMLGMIMNYERYDRKIISETAIALFNYERIGKKIADIYSNILRL